MLYERNQSSAFQLSLSRLAQSVERQTLIQGFPRLLGVHLNVVGSSPTLGEFFCQLWLGLF